MSLQNVLVALGLMGLAFVLAWTLEHDRRLSTMLAASLAAQILALEDEVQRLEVRQAALPDCFQYAASNP